MFEQTVKRWMERILYISKFAALLILLILTVDIICTKVFSWSITGAKAFVEMLMVLLVFLTIPFVTADRNHIVVDLIKFPRKVARVLDVIQYLFGFLLSGFFVWRTFVFLQEAVASKKIMLGTEGWLNFPLWPIAISIVFGFVLTALIYIMQLIIAVGFPENKQPAQEH